VFFLSKAANNRAAYIAAKLACAVAKDATVAREAGEAMEAASARGVDVTSAAPAPQVR